MQLALGKAGKSLVLEPAQFALQIEAIAQQWAKIGAPWVRPAPEEPV